MQVVVEKLSPVLVEFQVTVPADRVKLTLDRAFSDLARTAHIKGFRKGKAPKQVLAHLFGDRVAADVGDKLVEDTLYPVLEEKKVRPISQPVIEKPKPSEKEDFAYRARFEVTPDIEKVLYEGLELKRAVYPIEDKMIDAEVEVLRQRHSTLEPLEAPRAAQKGDVTTIDFELEVDGKVIAEAAGKDVTAELGSDTLLPALSEGLIGKEIGSNSDITTSFPDNHPHDAFRGKTATFHVNLKDIKERKLPALDDDFAKDLGKFDSFEALRNDIKARLERTLKDRSENELAEAMVAELCNKNPVPVPPSLVKQQAQMQEQEIIQQARRGGQNIKNLSEDLRQRVAVDAEMKVRAGLLMAEIAKAQKLQIVDDDIQKAYAELAEQTGKNINKVKAQYQDAKQRELLIGMILEDKVLNIIEAASIITDHVVAAEEK